MRNLLVEIAYNGTRYHGYQVQKGVITIEEAVQDAIEAVLKKREDIVGCSRTDAGVHANSYCFNMKTEVNIPLDRFIYAMNYQLPRDIAVKSCKEVPMDFHARHSCKGKEYVYKICDDKFKDPFVTDFALFHSKKLNIRILNRSAKILVGKHDFSAFTSLPLDDEKSRVRTIEYIKFKRVSGNVYIYIKGDGFLYNMVRIIVGTLLYINDGRIDSEDLKAILEEKKRKNAGITAPPQGLYLNKIFY